MVSEVGVITVRASFTAVSSVFAVLTGERALEDKAQGRTCRPRRECSRERRHGSLRKGQEDL